MSNGKPNKQRKPEEAALGREVRPRLRVQRGGRPALVRVGELVGREETFCGERALAENSGYPTGLTRAGVSVRGRPPTLQPANRAGGGAPLLRVRVGPGKVRMAVSSRARQARSMTEHITHTHTVRRLERSSSDKMLAGVCGGLGRYFDLNPTVFRVGFVVLTLLGGAGVLVYLAAALVMPGEGKERSLAEQVLAERKERPWPLIGLAIVGVALIVLLSRAALRPAAGAGWIFVLVVGLVVLWVSRSARWGGRLLRVPRARRRGARRLRHRRRARVLVVQRQPRRRCRRPRLCARDAWRRSRRPTTSALETCGSTCRRFGLPRRRCT